MSETPPKPGGKSGEGAAEAGEDSIMGSLPRSRPAVRSPRRDAAAKARARRSPQPAGKAAGEGDRPEEPEESANLEDLARAGATTAVEIAAAGLRFAGRAAGAIRESLERR